MTQLIVLLIVLFISGALIAAMGDRLGTYIGKKRLSGFGLRPKHTAMLYTMLFGGLIAVITVAVMLLINKNFQRALIHGSDLIKSNEDMQIQLNSRQHQLNRIQTLLSTVTTQSQAAEQKEYAAEQLKYIAQQNLGHTQLVLSHRQLLLGKQKALLSTSLKELNKAKEDLDIEQSVLSLARQGLFTEKDSLARATATVHGQEHRVADLEKKSSALAFSIQNLSYQNQSLAQEHDKLVQQPIIYNKGQEIDRTIMSTNQTYSDIRNEVVAFLDQLSKEAVQLHGKVGKNDRAVVMLPGDVDDQQQYVSDNLTEDLTIDNLAHSIQDAENQTDSVVLIATAHINSFSGEQTQARILMYPNVLVFQKGTQIATTTIDGSQPEDIILGYLGTFLVKSVRPVAEKRGVLPVRDRNGDLSVGAPTDSTQTLAVIKQIESIGSGAILTAYAASDTYSNGPLRIKMVASAPPSPPTPAVLLHPVAPPSTPLHATVPAIPLPAAIPTRSR